MKIAQLDSMKEFFGKKDQNGQSAFGSKKVRIVLLIIVLAVAAVIIVNPFGSATAESVKAELDRRCKSLENNSSAQVTENELLSGILYDELAKKLEEGGYVFYLFDGKKSVVKKNVDSEGNKYTFELFGEKYGELSGKRYFYDGVNLYDTTNGSEQIEPDKSDRLLSSLMEYLPEKICTDQSFYRLIAFADKDTLEMSEAFYGNEATAYIDRSCFIQNGKNGLFKIVFDK